MNEKIIIKATICHNLIWTLIKLKIRKKINASSKAIKLCSIHTKLRDTVEK